MLQEEKSRLEEAIARLATEEGVVSDEEGERVAAIRQAYKADREKLGKIKALLVSECVECVTVGVALENRCSLKGRGV